MKKQLLFLVLLLTTSLFIQAQNSPSKYGKVSKEELERSICPIDSNAHAYFIFDCGESHFEYPQTTIRENDPAGNSGFVLYTTRHFRMQILDESAFDWADIEVPLYVSGSKEEKLLSFKACTYNLDNGKIEKTKFSKSNLIHEKTSENWKTVKAPLPNVKKGSIIEVYYTVTSEFYFNLSKWLFQYSIPVLFSNYDVKIPEYFTYHQNIVGYYPVQTKSYRRNSSIEITYIWEDYGTKYKNSKKYDFFVECTEYSGNNIPAFTKDSYLRTSINYLSAVEFELSSTKFPNTQVKYYTSKWESVIKEFSESSDFGDRIKRVGFLEDAVDDINSKSNDPLNKMMLAYTLIANHYKWNEKNSVSASKKLKESYKDGVGNSADINLCLVGLLQSLDIEAYPVLISTQSHGYIRLIHASITDFNYVVVLSRINGIDYLMDATEPLTVINQLPVRCLNDKGLVVNPDKVEWINPFEHANSKSQTSLKYTIDDELQLKGDYSAKMEGYAELNQRKEIKSYTSNEEYIKEVSKNNPGIEIDSFAIKGLDSLLKPVEFKFNFIYSNVVEGIGDLLMIKPLLFETTKQSPFKLKERIYPVEFDYPEVNLITSQINIPEGYTVESLPAPVNMSLPDRSARFVYTSSQSNGTVLITFYFIKNKTLYLPNEYSALKEFYRIMVAKQNEKVVFKKI